MNTIFVYSGTGNSLASAKLIGEKMDIDVVQITAELANSDSSFEGDIGIVIYPVYAYGMPMTVKRFIRNNKFGFKYFAVLTTIGSSSGGAFAEAIRLFRRKKQKVHYTQEILSVENFVHLFKLPPEEVITQKIEGQNQKTLQVIQDLCEQKTNKRFLFRPESDFISMLFRFVKRLFAKNYKITDACNGCRVCYRVCPSRAIEMKKQDEYENLRPKVCASKCDHCQACMQLCPRHAIVFAKIKPESRRYRHSDVALDELFKRE